MNCCFEQTEDDARLDALLIGTLEMYTLEKNLIIIVIPFKTAALLVANQVTNASVISMDCRIV
jgi:hypothetical protein